jgi:NAD(P)-dependent dehydrogenase (short-subunit alcohol dehydrogenase family)
MEIIGLMHTLKLEVFRYGIQVNTVTPNADIGMTKGGCIGDTGRSIAAEEVQDRFDEIFAIDRVREFNICGEVYSMNRPLTGGESGRIARS